MLHAYHYICLNFAHAEDEICLVGFSRRAYTAYLLASFISRVGLLKRSGLVHMNSLYTIWKLWQGSRFLNSQELSQMPSPLGISVELSALPNLPPEEHLLEKVISKIRAQDQLITGVKIEACALWDTVSAIEIPTLRWFEPRRYTKCNFVDNHMPKRIRNVFYALALNEQRRDFTPVLFTSPPDGTN